MDNFLSSLPQNNREDKIEGIIGFLETAGAKDSEVPAEFPEAGDSVGTNRRRNYLEQIRKTLQKVESSEAEAIESHEVPAESPEAEAIESHEVSAESPEAEAIESQRDKQDAELLGLDRDAQNAELVQTEEEEKVLNEEKEKQRQASVKFLIILIVAGIVISFFSFITFLFLSPRTETFVEEEVEDTETAETREELVEQLNELKAQLAVGSQVPLGLGSVESASDTTVPTNNLVESASDTTVPTNNLVESASDTTVPETEIVEKVIQEEIRHLAVKIGEDLKSIETNLEGKINNRLALLARKVEEETETRLKALQAAVPQREIIDSLASQVEQLRETAIQLPQPPEPNLGKSDVLFTNNQNSLEELAVLGVYRRQDQQEKEGSALPSNNEDNAQMSAPVGLNAEDNAQMSEMVAPVGLNATGIIENPVFLQPGATFQVRLPKGLTATKEKETKIAQNPRSQAFQKAGNAEGFEQYYLNKNTILQCKIKNVVGDRYTAIVEGLIDENGFTPLTPSIEVFSRTGNILRAAKGNKKDLVSPFLLGVAAEVGEELTKPDSAETIIVGETVITNEEDEKDVVGAVFKSARKFLDFTPKEDQKQFYYVKRGTKVLVKVTNNVYMQKETRISKAD